METIERFFTAHAIVKDKVYAEEAIECKSVEEALEFAEDFAYDFYYQNPDRDLLEIQRDEKVDEDTAQLIFMKEMFESCVFFINEITTVDNKVLNVLQHYPKHQV